MTQQYGMLPQHCPPISDTHGEHPGLDPEPDPEPTPLLVLELVSELDPELEWDDDELEELAGPELADPLDVDAPAVDEPAASAQPGVGSQYVPSDSTPPALQTILSHFAPPVQRLGTCAQRGKSPSCSQSAIFLHVPFVKGGATQQMSPFSTQSMP